MLFNEYYYNRYRQLRKNIKQNISSNNFQTAKTELDNVITEHNNKYSTELLNQKKDFNYGERLILIQAKNHIQEALIDENNPDLYFVDDNFNRTLGKHSDLINQILEQTPKSDYKEDT